MKKLVRTALVALATLFSATVMAVPVSSPVLLGSIEHLYGSSAGRQLPSIMDIYHPGGNCDTAIATGINVKATKASTCNRFADAFNFSGIDFDSIDHFALTLDFTNARNQLGGLERWNVRGASNYVQSANTFGTALNAQGMQTFVFDNSQALFNDILNAESFLFSFATSAGAAMNFHLNSAKLEVFGTPAAVAEVPEPGSLALLGLSMVALVGARRVRKAKNV